MRSNRKRMAKPVSDAPLVAVHCGSVRGRVVESVCSQMMFSGGRGFEFRTINIIFRSISTTLYDV